MADFKTHVTFSSVAGCGYAFAGMTAGMGFSTSLVAGGLCGLSGMLPDVDSDSGIPRRETMGFAAAIVPMLLVSRFTEMGMAHDDMVLATAAIYFGIRFGLSRLIGRFSVHRGMWHSIPAALIFAGLAFLITGSENEQVKYFKAFAVFLGTMSHLVLDEIYSVDTRGVIPKFKKSFGTAVKFWGKNPWANFSTYAKLAVVALAVFGDASTLRTRIREGGQRMAGDLSKAWGDQVHSGWDSTPAPTAPQRQSSQPFATQPTQPPQQQTPYPPPSWGPAPGGGGFAPNRGAPQQQAPYGYQPQSFQGWPAQR